MNTGDFLGACVSGDVETVRQLARELDPDGGRDMLLQGIVAATISGTTAVVELLQSIADGSGAASGEEDAENSDATAASNTPELAPSVE